MLGPYELNQIYTGDARELAQAIPDESIDLIFSDPVYWQVEDYAWLAEMAARVLKPGGDVLVYSGGYYLGPSIAAMSPFLTWGWLLVEKKLTSGSKIWVHRLFNHYVPIIWMTKGKSRIAPNRLDFIWSQSEGNAVNHEWSKGARRCAQWLSRFGQPGDVILDPFCGGGAIASACKLLKRSFIAFEIEPATADLARQRVAMTQPPLFVVQPEQLELAV